MRQIVINRPTVMLEDGPKNGWCYFRDDAEELRRIAERMGTEFPYRPTRRRRTHPRAMPYDPSKPPAANRSNECVNQVEVWRWIHAAERSSTMESELRSEPDVLRRGSRCREVYDVVAETGRMGATAPEVSLVTGTSVRDVHGALKALVTLGHVRFGSSMRDGATTYLV